MKILVILNDLDIGGAQNYTISLMNEFVRFGHEVHLIVLSENLFLQDRLDKQIQLKILPRQKKLDFMVLRKIRFEIKHNVYDGIISSYIYYQTLSTLFIRNLPVTIYPIHSTVERNRKSYWLNYIMYRLKRNHEIFLTSIDSQTSYLIKKYCLRQNFFSQIYNGVDTEKFTLPPSNFDRNSFLTSIGIQPLNKIILMVAGFREEKRHKDALNAFKQLRKIRNDVEIIFIGDNREEVCKELQEYSSFLQLDNIHFFTAKRAGDVRNYYWSADLFTLTSNKVETFPISVLEALSCGLRCVLTDTGGIKDIICDKCYGLVVPVENPTAIAYAWEELLSNNHEIDKVIIRNYVLSNFLIKNSAQQYIKLIKKLNVN